MNINLRLPLFFTGMLFVSFFNFSFGQAAMVKVTIESNTEGDSLFEVLMPALLVLAFIFAIFFLFKKKK